MINTSNNVKPLNFVQQDENSWVAVTPIGRYFIDKEEKYEIYSDIEEFKNTETLEKAIDKLNILHSAKIKMCLL